MKINGFTLIELMIVVAIIGILASIASTNFQESSRIAADNAAKADATNAIILVVTTTH